MQNKQRRKLIINKFSENEETSSSANTSLLNAFGNRIVKKPSLIFTDNFKAKELSKSPPKSFLKSNIVDH